MTQLTNPVKVRLAAGEPALEIVKQGIIPTRLGMAQQEQIA